MISELGELVRDGERCIERHIQLVTGTACTRVLGTEGSGTFDELKEEE